MRVGKNKQGFTIVELLIVVVVIAILAAITVVSYMGIQDRAQTSVASADLTQNSKVIMNAVTTTGTNYLASSIMAPGVSQLKFDSSKYRVVTYCSNASDFVLLVETNAGKKFYQKNGSNTVNNDAIDSFSPCATAGVSGALTTYANLPAPCGGENTTCTFSGTATVVYGSAAQGRFNRLANQSGSVECKNVTFGDAAPGFTKACYIIPN